jgi:RHS repeat-associated protein
MQPPASGRLPVFEASSGEKPLFARFSRKEQDEETGFYYYGARYLNPKTSMWISADPAMGDYVPRAPVDDEAKKHNGNLPGMGGVYNYVNMHVYHYAGNNPIKYIDPDGRDLVHIENSKINRVVGYLNSNSQTFREHMNSLVKNKNGLGQRLVVFFTFNSSDHAGETSTTTGPADNSVSTVYTLSENGNLVWGVPIKKGEEIHGIQINIDPERINSNERLLAVIAEEVMHASDVAEMGSEAWNKRCADEDKMYPNYNDRPRERTAKARVQQVFNEIEQSILREKGGNN